MDEIEKLKRHIQLMEGNGNFVKVDDFETFCDERKRWADSIGSWAREVIWPLELLCRICDQQFELYQKDLNGSHIDMSHLERTGYPTIARLPAIIGCKSCNVEDVYNLPDYTAKNDDTRKTGQGETLEAGILDLLDMNQKDAEDWIASYQNLLQGIDPKKIDVLYQHEDDQPTICVITPTIGRPTLRQTLESGAADLGPGDLWIVLGDGPQPEALEICKKIDFNCRPAFLESVAPLGDYGNSLRDQAMSIATQDYFIFLDDDDIFVPGAISIIKREIAEHYPRPIMFRMMNGNGEFLWRTREVTPGNVGGSMFCCPNTPGRLGTWANGSHHRSDFNFIKETLKLYGPGWRQNLFWSGDVIIHCRPGGGEG